MGSLVMLNVHVLATKHTRTRTVCPGGRFAPASSSCRCLDCSCLSSFIAHRLVLAAGGNTRSLRHQFATRRCVRRAHRNLKPVIMCNNVTLSFGLYLTQLLNSRKTLLVNILTAWFSNVLIYITFNLVWYHLPVLWQKPKRLLPYVTPQ